MHNIQFNKQNATVRLFVQMVVKISIHKRGFAMTTVGHDSHNFDISEMNAGNGHRHHKGPDKNLPEIMKYILVSKMFC